MVDVNKHVGGPQITANVILKRPQPADIQARQEPSETTWQDSHRGLGVLSHLIQPSHLSHDRHHHN